MSDIFSDAIKHEAGERQDWLCGLCGEPLQDEDGQKLVYYEAHHVDGDVANTADPDNCILLCAEHPRHCHLLIHAWHTTNHPVEDYEFRFFDGDPDALDADADDEADG